MYRDNSGNNYDEDDDEGSGDSERDGECLRKRWWFLQ